MITSPTDSGETMEDPSAQESQTPMDNDQSDSNTASLPIDFCGEPPKEGDIIRVKVVSVDADNGSFDVVCVPSMEKPMSSIKSAAASFES